MYKRPEKTSTCPNKQFQQKIHLFFLPTGQDEINMVIFVWIHELENNAYSLFSILLFFFSPWQNFSEW